MKIIGKFKSETLKKLAPFSWWIQSASVPIGSPEAKIILESIDNVCFILEEVLENKKVLSEKVTQLCFLGKKEYQTNDGKSYISCKDLNESEQEHRRQVWDFLNELRACVWLLDNKFSHIEIIAKQNIKTPDIKAIKDNAIYYIEVKTLHEPREEEIRLMSKNIQVKDVERSYHQPLKNKIDYFVNDADTKFNSVHAEKRILLVYYYLSISAWLTNNSDKRNLDDILGVEYFNRLEIEKNIKVIKISQS